MMKISVHKERLELRQPFVIARGTSTHADLLVVTISKGNIVGRGEGSPQQVYGQSVESCERQIEMISSRIEAGVSREQLLELLPAGSARNAVDCALWDFEAKLKGISVWEIAGLADPNGPLKTDITIGIGSPDKMRAEASGQAGFEVLKVKLNRDLVEERLAAVRMGAPRSRLMVDINEGWTFEELETYLPVLQKYDVELLEQPLPRGQDETLADFKSPIPICADESCFDRSDLACLKGRYRFINIKLDKTGGLTEALLLASEAKKLGFGLMTGCMKGTSLAMAPGFVVSSLCAFRDLDAPTLLKEDRTPAMRIEAGWIHPFEPGLWG